jgi:hypothetical protein
MPTILQDHSKEKRNAKLIYRIRIALSSVKFAAIVKNKMPNEFKTFMINKQNK